MSDDGFFWLLSQQRDAALNAKTKRKAQQESVVAARNVVEQPSTAGPPLKLSDGAAQHRQLGFDAPKCPGSAAAALLLALAGDLKDVPAFLHQHGFTEHKPGSAALKAAAFEALLSVLLTSPAGSSTRSSAAASPAAATAAPEVGDTAAAAAAAVAAIGVPSLVRSLLELGADPSGVRQQDGTTPLVAALSCGHLEAAGLLLDAFAQPDPPVWAAAAAEEAAGAAAAGAAAGPAAEAGGRGSGGGAGGSGTPKRKRKGSGAAEGGSRDGSSAAGGAGGSPAVAVQPIPLVLAVVAGREDLVERLLTGGADVNRQCTVQLAGGQAAVCLTPLVAAVQTGSTALVGRLLTAGADPIQKCIPPGTGGVGWTSPLSAAVLGASHEVVQQLVAAGACVARNGGAHIGPEHPALRAVVLAAQRGKVEAVQLLYSKLAAALQGGPDAMLGMLRRRTALHPLAAAAERGHLAVVDCLLRLGAPPNHDRSVWAGVAQHTPLMLAAANGHVHVVERLLAAGAWPLKPNAREEMAASLALQRGQLATLLCLLRHGGELAGPAAAGSAFELAEGLPCLQLANASRAWQLGWTSGSLSRGSKPMSLPALEQERQRYRLLVLALLGAHAASSSGSGSSAAGKLVGAAGSSRAGGSSGTCSGGAHAVGASAAAGAAVISAAAQLRQLATPASLAHAAAASEALLDAMLSLAGLSMGCVIDRSDGSFPLLAAAHHGWLPMQRLLARGADPNQADSRGNTVLMLMAARPAMLEAAKQLLSWNAEQAQQAGGSGGVAAAAQRAGVEPRAPPPQPPPQQQAANGSAAAATAAAQAGSQEQAQQQQQQQQQHGQQQQPPPAQLRAQQHRGQHHHPQLELSQVNSEGRDAVGVAIAAKNRRVAEELLAHWAVQAAPAARQAEVSAAAAGVAARAFDLLGERGALSVGDINKPVEGQHLLLAQIQSASRKQLRQVLSLPGLDLNFRHPASGRTPLMLLTCRQQPSLVADLLASGRMELEARDPSGATAALLAGRAGDAGVLRVLLDAGADVDCADNSGDTLLMCLARQGQHKLLSELLHARHAASINCQDGRGWAALHHAAAAGHFNACRVLRVHGADPGLCTAEGAKMALDLAREAGHNACLPLLQPVQQTAGRQAEA